MDLWFKSYWNLEPNSNQRLNKFIIDYDVDNIQFTNDVFSSPLDKAISAVHKITSKYPGPYVLLASGGVDSQAMIWAWYKSGVPFEICHYSYDGWNYHDTEYLKNFLNKIGIANKLKIVNLDAIDFISSPQLKSYAKKFDCSSPQILTYIKYVENTAGTPIMGGNFIQHDICGLSHTLLALQRYSEQERPNFIPFFFQSTPELAYTFFQLDSTYRGQNTGKDAGYIAKCRCYETSGFPVIRQYEKYTGFEKIKTYFDSESVDKLDQIKWRNMPSKRTFDIKYRYSLYDHIGYYDDGKVIIKHHRQINSILTGE